MMERIEQIINHPLYVEQYNALLEDEKDRIYCRHDLGHLLDVARICYIYCLEEGKAGNSKGQYSKAMIYAAAMLHDIGRHMQNAENVPHEVAGVQIAGRILADCKYAEHEIEAILDAISDHRHAEHAQNFAGYLFRADKRCRKCFACKAVDTCKWEQEKMNLKVEI